MVISGTRFKIVVKLYPRTYGLLEERRRERRGTAFIVALAVAVGLLVALVR